MAIPKLFQIDWAHLLVPTVALGEIILRGSLVYVVVTGFFHTHWDL